MDPQEDLMEEDGAEESGDNALDWSQNEGDERAVSGKRKKTKRPEYNENGEEIYCVCRDTWDGDEFMIACDECGEW